MVPVDQAPLRKDTEKECRRAMKTAARLREQIEEYERSVVPSYERWLTIAFGSLLDEEQAAEHRIAELEDLITEVTAAQFWSGGSQRSAYQKVMNERSKGEDREKPEDEDFDDDEEDLGDPKNDKDLSMEEQMFREFVRNVLSLNPDKLGKAEYRSLFKEFRSQSGLGGNGREDGDAGSVGSALKKRDHPARVKELYRLLVRRLHPDSGADYDGESARLWHTLQEAYQNNDLERLEILLAVTDIHDGSGTAQASLFHLRQVTAEFLRGERSLRQKLVKLRKTPAYLFSVCKDLVGLEARTRAKIDKRLHVARGHLRHLEELVGSWKSEPAKKSPKTKTARPAKNEPKSQQKFSF
ncbi:MAG: J domain-containing protein [Terrimicrobiaceae bacterium]